MNFSSFTIGYTAMLLVAALWGLGFPVMKGLIKKFGVFDILFYRFCIAGIIIWVLSIRPGILKNINSKLLLKDSIQLGLLLTFSFIFLISGLKSSSSETTAFYASLTAVWTPLILFVGYRVKVSRFELIAIMAAVISIAIVSNFKFQNISSSDLSVILGSFIFSLYIIKLDTTKINEKLLLTGTQFGVVIIVLGLFLGLKSSVNNLSTAQYSDWVALLVAAIACTVLPFFLQTRFQQKLSPTIVSLIFLAEPFFTVLFAHFLYGEPMDSKVLAAISIFTAANIFVVLGHGKVKKEL